MTEEDIETPTPKEIKDAIQQLTNKFESKEQAAIVVSILYENLVVKLQAQEQLENDQSKQTLSFNRVDSKVPANKALTEQEDQIFTVNATPLYPSCRNQMDFILHYEKKIAAQTFIKRGYGLQYCKDQIQRKGGLFEMTQYRYKWMATTFVTQAYQRLQKFLQDIKIPIIRAHKVQTIALFSILLNCNKYFTVDEQIVFLNFISLLYDQQIESVQISKKAALMFYQKSKQFVKQKLRKGRGTGINEVSLSASLDTRLGESIQNNIVKRQWKSEKDMYDQCIINYYIQTQSIGQTKQKFEKQHGTLPEYQSHRQIQSVVFRFIRKTLRDIEQFCKKHYQQLPPLALINDLSIKLILTSNEGAGLRTKILLFNRLNQFNLVLLVDLIRQINKYLDSKPEFKNRFNYQTKSMSYKSFVSVCSSSEQAKSETNSSKKKRVMTFNNSKFNMCETSSVQQIIDP